MKIKYVLELIRQIEKVPAKFLAPITGYAGLFEVRVEYESNIYRIFCCFDKENLLFYSTDFRKRPKKLQKGRLKRQSALSKSILKIKTKSHDRL